MVAVTGVLTVKAVPLPSLAIFQLAKAYPVLLGAVGNVPTVPPYAAVLLVGFASIVPPFYQK